MVNEPHKGLTRARARGMAASTSPYLAFIDADTHVTPVWFDTIIDVFTSRSDVVCLSGPRRYFGIALPKRWFLNSVWVVAPLAYGIVGYMLLGGNFVVRRDALLAIGGFDQSIDFYGEDTLLAKEAEHGGASRLSDGFLCSCFRGPLRG